MMSGHPTLDSARHFAQQQASQDSSPRRLNPREVANIRNRIWKWLDNPKCQDFVNSLLATAGEIAKSQNPYNTFYAASPDVLVLFDMIENKGKGFNYDRSLPYNTVRGSIVTKDPSVWLLPPESHSASLSSEERADTVAEAGFHETIHQMTRGHLSDQILAQAILKMPIKLDVLPKGDITSNTLYASTNASYFWNHYLFQHCFVKGK